MVWHKVKTKHIKNLESQTSDSNSGDRVEHEKTLK